jgi:hypothetical protein
VGDKRIGDLKVRWFVLSTAILSAIALLIFVPLSRNMKTVDETSELQKQTDVLKERVREIDVLRGEIETLKNKPLPDQKTVPPGPQNGKRKGE